MLEVRGHLQAIHQGLRDEKDGIVLASEFQTSGSTSLQTNMDRENETRFKTVLIHHRVVFRVHINLQESSWCVECFSGQDHSDQDLQ